MALVVFDVYGTLLDVSSADAACEAAVPGRGAEIGSLWRAKQLDYTLLVTLMNRYVDFWEITRRALLVRSARDDSERAHRAAFRGGARRISCVGSVPGGSGNP